MKIVYIVLFVVLLLINLIMVRHLKDHPNQFGNKSWFLILTFETFMMAVMLGGFIGFVEIEDLFTLDIKKIIFFLVETVIMTSCWMGMLQKIVLNKSE